MMLYNGDTDLRLNVFSQTSIILQIYHLQHHPQIFIRRVHETQVNHAKSWIDFEPWALQYSPVILCTCRYLKYMYSGPTLMFVYLSVWMIWWNRYSLPGEIFWCRLLSSELYWIPLAVFHHRDSSWWSSWACEWDSHLLWSTTWSADWSDRAASNWTTQIFEDLCRNVTCCRRVLLRWNSSSREIYITILTNRILNPVLFRFLKTREQYQGCRLPLVSPILSFTALRIAPEGTLQFLC